VLQGGPQPRGAHRFGQQGQALRALAFMDTGRAHLRAAGGAAAATAHATSFGLGLRWQWRRQLSVSMD